MIRSTHSRPLVFAHRGACRVAPENTVSAFEAAIRLGADGAELDVQYSSDGRLMIFHNPTLEHTTNGSGRLTAHTYEELRQLDAGSHFGTQFAGERIPTLEEILELAKGKILLNVEVKAFDFATASLGADVVKVVRQFGMTDQVVISSFNPLALRQARKTAPEIEGGLLLAPDLPAWMRARLVQRYSLANALHPEHVMVDATYVAQAQRFGFPVRPWTVNEEDDMRRMIALRVDAIITDLPDKLVALLR